MPYLRQAVDVYGMSLPRAYQRDVSSLFSQSADTTTEMSIPGALAVDWAIVMMYLTETASTIDAWLASHGAASYQTRPELSLDAESGNPPVVIQFDRLAALTTEKGARRLEQAALAVQHHLAAEWYGLSERARHLLELVAAGRQIVDIAGELHYSERTIYRRMAELWRHLGVPNRAAGLQMAASEGLID